MTAAGPVGIAREDRPARGNRRTGGASRGGGREGGRFPSRDGCRNETKCNHTICRSIWQRQDLRVSGPAGGTKWVRNGRTGRIRPPGESGADSDGRVVAVGVENLGQGAAESRSGDGPERDSEE